MSCKPITPPDGAQPTLLAVILAFLCLITLVALFSVAMMVSTCGVWQGYFGQDSLSCHLFSDDFFILRLETAQ